MAKPAAGLTLALASAAAFGVSGGFAKSLLDSGWSPGLPSPCGSSVRRW